MDNEQKNELSVLIRDKVKMIKRGIIAVVLILIVAFLAVFFKGRSSATEKYENKIQILKKLQKNFYRDGIQMIALSQLLLLLYILAMTDGMRQKAFRRCFLRQMNPLKNFFQITNFI